MRAAITICVKLNVQLGPVNLQNVAGQIIARDSRIHFAIRSYPINRVTGVISAAGLYQSFSLSYFIPLTYVRNLLPITPR